MTDNFDSNKKFPPYKEIVEKKGVRVLLGEQRGDKSKKKRKI